MNDYRVGIKVRNNRILRAIEESGGEPGQKWCARNGLVYATVNDLINMTISPILDSGELIKQARLLCDVLNKLPEDLWSNEQLYPLERNYSEMEMNYRQVMSMLPGEQRSYLLDTSEIDNEQTGNAIEKALSALTKRNATVLRLRYFEGLSFEEIGQQLGVGRERVRQIEAKSLRTLRKLPDVMDALANCKMGDA